MLEYEHFKTLPELVLRRHFPDRLEDEDILQEGRVELLKALAEQRKAKNFFPWAYKQVYRAYVRYIRDEWPDHTDIDEISVADPTSQTHEDVIDLCETVSHLLRLPLFPLGRAGMLILRSGSPRREKGAPQQQAAARLKCLEVQVLPLRAQDWAAKTASNSSADMVSCSSRKLATTPSSRRWASSRRVQSAMALSRMERTSWSTPAATASE